MYRNSHSTKERFVQSKGQIQQTDGDYKFLTCCSIVSFSFSFNFYLVAATTGGLLVSLCVYFKLALLLLHPGPFQLITVTSNVLMA